MGYFSQLDIEKQDLINSIKNSEVLLNNYFNLREKHLAKWDSSQFMLDDLQQDLGKIKEMISDLE